MIGRSRARSGASRIAPLIALGIAAPALVGLAYAVLAAGGVFGAGADGATWRHVAAVLRDPTTWRSLLFTAWVAGASTLVATALAAGLAVGLRGRTIGDRTARLLAALPLPVPHLVAAAIGVLVLAQSGLLARGLHALGVIAEPAAMPALTYDATGIGIIAVLVWKELPFLAVVAFALVATRDRSLEEAARTLGASARQVNRHVLLPRLLRGLAPAIVAVFLFAVGTYETAVLLAPIDPSPLAVLTYERLTAPALSQRPEAYVLALLGFAIAIGGVFVHERVRT